MERVSPTRMNLLSRKSQLTLARDGVKLLKHKREVLMKEFMELVKPLVEKQRDLHKEMVEAFHCLTNARAIDGTGTLESAVLFREQPITIEIHSESKWGIELPHIDGVEGIGHEYREPYSHSITLRIFETRERFEGIVDKILELAPIEASMKRLGREIQKTTRRINALEEMLMPRLNREIRYIRSTLEEREREDNFRLRHIKSRKENGRE